MTGSRVEKLGNVMFIVMCLAMSVAALQYVFTTRSAAAPARKAPVAAGTRLTLPGAATADGQTAALLLVLSSQCRFCTDSMPFYARLSQLPEVRSGRLRMSAVSLRPEDPMDAYLSAHKLSVAAVIPIAQAGFNVMGTPSLVLVDSGGVVKESWAGWLDPDQEKDVISSLSRLAGR